MERVAIARARLDELLARPDVGARLEAHATEAFPRECCALLFGRAEGEVELVLSDNLADRLHAADPESFPQGSESAFVLDLKAMVGPLKRGLELLAIIHSHCRVGAYFSAEDTRLALGPDGEPLHPGVVHVVLDVRDDGVRGYEVFAWSEGARAFLRW